MGRYKVEKLQSKCQICNKDAVGFHYGAYVCEACKKFFVRHASGVCKAYGSCQEKGGCNLEIEGRGKCQHCRYKRCLELGMSITHKTSEYDLTSIPCQVCGSKSSGLHFGCITCEGCKGFFRRMIKFKGTLVCFDKNECELNFKSRNMCKSCRLNRCVNIGMSRKGIRIGRHPNFLKHRCIQEVEKKMSMNAAKKEKITTNISMETDTSDGDEEIEKTQLQEDSISDKNINNQLDGSVCCDSGTSESLTNDAILTNNDQSCSSSENIKSIDRETEVVVKDETSVIDNNNNNNNNDNNNIDNNNIDNNNNNNSQSPCKFGTDILQHKIESTNSEFNVPNDKPSLESIEHILYSISDISNLFFTRPIICLPFSRLLKWSDSIHTVWSKMMDHFLSHSQYTVKLAKRIPGFLDLNLPDKKTAIKFSLYPMILIELSREYSQNADSTYFNYFDFNVEDRNVIFNLFPEFHEFSFHVCESSKLIHQLNFDSVGLLLLCGIAIFYNYNQMINWKFGQSMLSVYQQCLGVYLQSIEYNITNYGHSSGISSNSNNNPRDSPSIIMKKCMDIIDLLSRMNERHHVIIGEFCSQHTELIYPDLYIEVFHN